MLRLVIAWVLHLFKPPWRDLSKAGQLTRGRPVMSCGLFKLACVVVSMMTLPVSSMAQGSTVQPRCDVARPIEALVEAWNTGSGDSIPLYYDQLLLTVSGPDRDVVTEQVGDPQDYLARRPALGDTLAVVEGVEPVVYPSGQSPDEWVYVVQPLTRSTESGGSASQQLIASLHCSTTEFGMITIQAPGIPIVAQRDSDQSETKCADDQVAAPLRSLVSAIIEGDDSAITTLLHQVTPSADERQVVRPGEYSFRMPSGEVLREGDADSFPVWITSQLSEGWTITSMELNWWSKRSDNPDDLAEAVLYFLLVNDSSGEAWRNIWKGVVIDCTSGDIRSLHGGTG